MNGRISETIVGVVAVALLSFVGVEASVAQTEIQIPVTTSTDTGAGSFRAAIQIANEATDPVRLVFSPGLNITLTSGDVYYTNYQTLTLEGNGSTVAGNGSERILVISSSAAPSLHIEHLTFKHGVAPTGTNGGGAIRTTGAVEVIDSRFHVNAVLGTAPGDVGGAIQSEGGTVRVVGSEFSFNSANSGGAIMATHVVATNSTFRTLPRSKGVRSRRGSSP